MGDAAELEIGSIERTAMSGGGMRALWSLDGGLSDSPAPDRRALAASIHRLLERWRAAEREVAAEVAEHAVSASSPAAPTPLDVITKCRVEHQRIFEALRALTQVDEGPTFAGPAGFERPVEIR